MLYAPYTLVVELPFLDYLPLLLDYLPLLGQHLETLLNYALYDDTPTGADMLITRATIVTTLHQVPPRSQIDSTLVPRYY